MGIDTAVQLSVAAQDAGIAPIVRVPSGDLALACRALDGGAMGIVMPHVQTAADARAFVDGCRYAPLGERGVAAAIPHTGFAPIPLAEGQRQADAAVLLIGMIETTDAAAQADEIAATPGLDALLVGSQDLCMNLGTPGDVGSDAAKEVVLDRHRRVPAPREVGGPGRRRRPGADQRARRGRDRLRAGRQRPRHADVGGRVAGRRAAARMIIERIDTQVVELPLPRVVMNAAKVPTETLGCVIVRLQAGAQGESFVYTMRNRHTAAGAGDDRLARRAADRRGRGLPGAALAAAVARDLLLRLQRRLRARRSPRSTRRSGTRTPRRSSSRSAGCSASTPMRSRPTRARACGPTARRTSWRSRRPR